MRIFKKWWFFSYTITFYDRNGDKESESISNGICKAHPFEFIHDYEISMYEFYKDNKSKVYNVLRQTSYSLIYYKRISNKECKLFLLKQRQMENYYDNQCEPNNKE